MEKLMLLVIVLCWMHLSTAVTTFQVEFLAEIIAENELKVTCDSDHESERVSLVSAARCSLPRDVLINLPSSEDNVVNPRAVFVKRCVGLCHATNRRCLPLRVRVIKIPVRFRNIGTGAELCGHYDVTEHINCTCARVT